MATAAVGTAKTVRSPYWGLLALIGLMATVAGLVMPQFLPADGPPAANKENESTTEPADLRYVPPQMPEAPSTRTMFLRLGGMTVAVLVLAVGVMLCGKYWMRGFAATGVSSGNLALVETLQLGNRCSLHLVQLSSRQVLVGADATGIKTVVPLPDAFDACLNDIERPPLGPARAA
jgi:flagellar biogenesis protein FliO